MANQQQPGASAPTSPALLPPWANGQDGWCRAVTADVLKNRIQPSDVDIDRYPKYLPASAVLATLFFELRKENSDDLGALDPFRTVAFNRGFYGGVILRGEGRNPDDSAAVQTMVSAEAIDAPLFGEGGLLNAWSMTAATDKVGDDFPLASLRWSGITFSDFAFDLLALLKGTYEHGRVSSLHGLDFRTRD